MEHLLYTRNGGSTEDQRNILSTALVMETRRQTRRWRDTEGRDDERRCTRKDLVQERPLRLDGKTESIEDMGGGIRERLVWCEGLCSSGGQEGCRIAVTHPGCA